jgi:hypothetical protein
MGALAAVLLFLLLLLLLLVMMVQYTVMAEFALTQVP